MLILTEVMKWLVGVLQKKFYHRYFNIFLDNYVIGVSQALTKKVIFQNISSALAFRLLRYFMYWKCTRIEVFFTNFANGLKVFFKNIVGNTPIVGVLICERLSLFQSFRLQTDWRYSVSNSFKQIKFNWSNS